MTNTTEQRVENSVENRHEELAFWKRHLELEQLRFDCYLKYNPNTNDSIIQRELIVRISEHIKEIENPTTRV